MGVAMPVLMPVPVPVPVIMSMPVTMVSVRMPGAHPLLVNATIQSVTPYYTHTRSDGVAVAAGEAGRIYHRPLLRKR